MRSWSSAKSAGFGRPTAMLPPSASVRAGRMMAAWGSQGQQNTGRLDHEPDIDNGPGPPTEHRSRRHAASARGASDQLGVAGRDGSLRRLGMGNEGHISYCPDVADRLKAFLDRSPVSRTR